jgi:hypothetical protein
MFIVTTFHKVIILIFVTSTLFICILQGEYKLSNYIVTVAVCTGTTAVISVEFSSLHHLQPSTDSPHRFPGAASESFAHSVDRLFDNTWPLCATLSLKTDASSIMKLFLPPLDRHLRRTTTSKLSSEHVLNRHKNRRKFQDTPTMVGQRGSHFPPTLAYTFPARWQ